MKDIIKYKIKINRLKLNKYKKFKFYKENNQENR